jgi:hypothetical protein
MKEFNEGQKERIEKKVLAEYEKIKHRFGAPPLFGKEYYIKTGVYILAAKWGIGPIPRNFYGRGAGKAGLRKPDKFIQAIIDNDLMGAFDQADFINVHGIRFFCHLLANVKRRIN